MKTLAALVSGSGWHVDDLRRAAERLDVILQTSSFEALSAEIGSGGRRSSVRSGAVELLDVDGVLVRLMPPGSLEQVVFRMDALHSVAAAGIPVLNPPRAIEAAVDGRLGLGARLIDRRSRPAATLHSHSNETFRLRRVWSQVVIDLVYLAA